MRLLATWLIAAVLAGCAVTRPVPQLPGLADVERFESWTAAGRLAMVAGEEGGSGSFSWRQSGASTTLSLRGPLGAGALEIVTDGQDLQVTDGSGHSADTAQAEQALRARLGADLPWNHLRYWMLGVPAPSPSADVVDGVTTPLRRIDQSGWRVDYETFRSVSGAALPGRFTAQRGAVKLKVVVDDWNVSAAAAPASP